MSNNGKVIGFTHVQLYPVDFSETVAFLAFAQWVAECVWHVERSRIASWDPLQVIM